jgi:hypothetical protein
MWKKNKQKRHFFLLAIAACLVFPVLGFSQEVDRYTHTMHTKKDSSNSWKVYLVSDSHFSEDLIKKNTQKNKEPQAPPKKRVDQAKPKSL